MIPILLTTYIVLWLNCNASTADKQAIRAELNSRFREPLPTNVVKLESLPKWRSATNTNVVGWVLCVDEAQLRNLNVTMTNVTVAKFDAWKTAKMTNPNHLQVRRGDDITNVLYSAGLEPVPVPGGPTP